MNNTGGTLIAGRQMTLNAGQNVDLTSSQIKAGSLSLTAGQNLNLETATQTESNFTGSRTTLGKQAGIEVVGNTSLNVGGNLNQKGASLSTGGDLNAQVGGDWNLTTVQTGEKKVVSRMGGVSDTDFTRNVGSSVAVGGNTQANVGSDLNMAGSSLQLGSQTGNTANLNVGGSVNLTAVKDVDKVNSSSSTSGGGMFGGRSGSGVQNTYDETVRGSGINSAGGLNVNAGRDVNVAGSQINSAGAATVSAGGSVNVTAVEERHSFLHEESGSHSTGLSKTSGEERYYRDSTNQVGASVGGATVSVNAGQDLSIKGSSVVSDSGTTLTAGRDVSIEAATSTSSRSDYSKKEESGFMSNGGLSVSYGDRSLAQANATQTTTAVASTVGAIGGNVNISAGQAYTQKGSDVLAPQGDVNIVAKTVNIEEAREARAQQQSTEFSQSGVTMGLTGGMIDTAQATLQGVKGASEANSNRNKTLNALIAYGKGADLYEQGKAVQRAYEQNGVMGDTDANGKAQPGAAAASGIKISVSVGSSQSQSNSSSTDDSAAGSMVKAGGSVNIRATEGDLTVQGSNVQADGDVVLKAAENVNIVASADTESNRSNNSSNASSVGVSVGIGTGGAGLSVDVAASRGRGQANSDSVTYNNSHVSAGKTVNIESGSDTNLKGGNVTGQQVTATVGGNLNIESLQDIAASEANQKTTGIAMSIPVLGSGGSASFSQNKQNSNSNYASVNEQSGIKAGDGGFQIHVQGNTDLKGATIVGSSDASKNTLTTNTLTTSNISNSMNASASSSGVSVDTNMMDGKYAMAKAVAGNLLNNGSAGQSDASMTTSAISAAQVTVGNKTTDTSKEQLTDSSGKMVSTDTTNTNRTLVKADVAALQQQAQQQQADNMLLVKTATAFTDPAFKAAFLDQAKMYKKQEDANGNVTWQEMTPEEKRAIPPGSRIANNGIFNGGANEPQAAQNLAEQNSAGDVQYLVHFPQANNMLSELLVAGYQKFLEGGAFGLTNATQQNVDLWNQTGGDITLDGHSRGGMTVGNALTAVKEQGGTGGATNANLYGSAYNAQDAANTVNQITNGVGQVKQSTNNYDFVGRILGGNEGTGGTTQAGSSVIKEALRTMGGAATVHNCYGSGHEGCDGFGKPELVTVPANGITGLGSGK